MEFALAARTSGEKRQRAVIFVPERLDLTRNLGSARGFQALPMEIIILIMHHLKDMYSAANDSSLDPLKMYLSMIKNGALSNALIDRFFDMVHFAITCKATLRAAHGVEITEPINNQRNLAFTTSFESKYKPKLSKKCAQCLEMWLLGGSHSQLEKWIFISAGNFPLADDVLRCPKATSTMRSTTLPNLRCVKKDGQWIRGMTKELQDAVNEWCE